jgi:hypothetical protein
VQIAGADIPGLKIFSALFPWNHDPVSKNRRNLEIFASIERYA